MPYERSIDVMESDRWISFLVSLQYPYRGPHFGSLISVPQQSRPRKTRSVCIMANPHAANPQTILEFRYPTSREIYLRRPNQPIQSTTPSQPRIQSRLAPVHQIRQVPAKLHQAPSSSTKSPPKRPKGFPSSKNSSTLTILHLFHPITSQPRSRK